MRLKTICWWLGAAALVAVPPAAAERPEGQDGQLPVRVSVLVSQEPVVTVSYEGDFGPMRLTGALVSAPEEPLRLTDGRGGERAARWDEVRELSLVRTITAELPPGSFTAVLSGDPGALTRPGASGALQHPSAGLGLFRAGAPSWRARSLPAGELRLRGEPFGEAQIPLSQVTQLLMLPLTGTLLAPPSGELRLEIAEEQVVSLAAAEVQAYRRDGASGIATVSLRDGQVLSGRIVALEEAVFQFEQEGTGARFRADLERVAQLEIILPPVTTLGIGADGD